MEKKKFYITTPIYYPSGKWHIGHCYTTVECDALARFKRMMGNDVFFLTGTDEHGQKIEKKALECGKQPKEYVDEIVAGLKDIWGMLDISYNKFIRTTDEEHVKSVQKIFQELYDRGEIYKAEYEGLYCTPCESFWTESQLVDGKCPDCGREVVRQKEESYFFRLSKYTDRIIKYYEENPSFLMPKTRVNEMLNNFLKPGLTDLCVSRTSLKWGIPVPFDDKHVIYVWIDALSNYITALGYGSDDTTLFKKYWPADVHVMAKEIIRFHSIIWPAILMALDIPLPKQVYGHGWLLIGGDKLSKSKSDNVKNELVEPQALCLRYGSDAVRYFLLREIPFGSDGVYTNESLINRINQDLANTLGNLVSRTTAMTAQYFGGLVPENKCFDKKKDGELISMAENLLNEVDKSLESLNSPEALSKIFDVMSRANKYIDENTPWILAKDESQKDRLGTVIYNLLETIRICSIMLMPFMTKAPKIILEALSINADDITDFESVKAFGGLAFNTKISKPQNIFPRIDVKKELEEIDKMVREEKKKEKENKKESKMEDNVAVLEEISIEDFAKIKLKVAKVIACEKVEKSDKLLKLSVKLGDETRTVVSGIAKSYTAEEMVGKSVILVSNLKPCKLRGILSEGMILCAEDSEGKLSLVSPISDIADGSTVR